METRCYCGSKAVTHTPVGAYCAAHAEAHWKQGRPLVYIDNAGWSATREDAAKQLRLLANRYGFGFECFTPIRFSLPPNMEGENHYTKACMETLQRIRSFKPPSMPTLILNSPTWNLLSPVTEEYISTEERMLLLRKTFYLPAVWVYVERDFVSHENPQAVRELLNRIAAQTDTKVMFANRDVIYRRKRTPTTLEFIYNTWYKVLDAYKKEGETPSWKSTEPKTTRKRG